MVCVFARTPHKLFSSTTSIMSARKAAQPKAAMTLFLSHQFRLTKTPRTDNFMLLNPSRLLLVVSTTLLLASCAHQPVAVTSGPSATPRSVTGIASCDGYLASYVSCHRAAGIFPADQLPAHYQAMRDSLLLDSQNPSVRPEMAQRCVVLATQLQQALHGKSCTTARALPSH